LKIFIVASFTLGIASSLFDAVFNNFLDDRFNLSGFQRSSRSFCRLPGRPFCSSRLVWFL
jgi:hypothetical protein